jgi:hypothetical protein
MNFFSTASVRWATALVSRRGALLRWLVLGTAFGSVAAAQNLDDYFDRIQDTLTASADDGRFRGRLSGTFDLEGYTFPQPAPGLLYGDGHHLVAPRLSLFLDAQIDGHVYAFAQARVDRGFDPGGYETEVRLDEYAVRVTPWSDSRFNLQVGKFATVIGNWTVRHDSWNNPFITAPLPYENLTGIWDVEAVRSGAQLLQWSHVRPGLPANITADEKNRRLPIVWGPSYVTGAAASGELGRLGYALEVKTAAPASRPDSWSPSQVDWADPTVSSRIYFRPDARWTLGISASAGTYLQPSADHTLPPGRSRRDYRELVLAHDAAFAWHHWQAWAEIYAARYEIPTVGHADTLAYYAEVKYKITPRFFSAVRWNEQLFGGIPDRGGSPRWGRNLARLDLGPGFRFTSHVQVKLQYSVQHGDSAARTAPQTLAAQLTMRF